MHEIQLISPQIWPSHKLTMQSHRLASKAFNLINKISSLKWGRKPCFYSKNGAQIPRGRIFQVWGGFGGWDNGGRSFEFMGGNYYSYIYVSHLVWESFTSSDHFIQVEKPPSMREFAPLLWLKMILYAHKFMKQYLQQLWHLRDKSQISCLWFRNWIFSNFPIY